MMFSGPSCCKKDFFIVLKFLNSLQSPLLYSHKLSLRNSRVHSTIFKSIGFKIFSSFLTYSTFSVFHSRKLEYCLIVFLVVALTRFNFLPTNVNTMVWQNFIFSWFKTAIFKHSLQLC